MTQKVIYSFLGKSPYKWVMIKKSVKHFCKKCYPVLNQAKKTIKRGDDHPGLVHILYITNPNIHLS